MIRFTVPRLLACTLIVLSSAPQAETLQAAYRAIHKGDKFEVALNDPASGRMIFYSTSKATQLHLQGTKIFDGATGGASGWWESIKGVSRGSGTVKYQVGEDVYQTEWNGVCFPITGQDGKGVPTCYGGFVLLPAAGTGRFANMRGGGRWTARMLPSGDFEENWEATYER